MTSPSNPCGDVGEPFMAALKIACLKARNFSLDPSNDGIVIMRKKIFSVEEHCNDVITK
jgi:hypothetical protein